MPRKEPQGSLSPLLPGQACIKHRETARQILLRTGGKGSINAFCTLAKLLPTSWRPRPLLQLKGQAGHVWSPLQLLGISLACAGLARCPQWEFPSFLAGISPSLHKEPFMEQVSECSSPSVSLQLACLEQGCATSTPLLPCEESCWKCWFYQGAGATSQDRRLSAALAFKAFPLLLL